MRDLSTFNRVGGLVAASSLLAAILLGLPSSTDESSLANPSAVNPSAASPAIARAADAPAAPSEITRVPPLDEARPDEASQARGAERPGVAGMVIGIDPETGKLGMPTREQLKELSELEQLRLDHSPADLVEVHHPDGSVSVDLQGRFQEFMTVRVGPDGKLNFQCVDGEGPR